MQVGPTLDLGFIPRKRVKLLRQTEIAECGLACLAMIATHHGLKIDLGSLRRRFSPSMRGVSLKSLMSIADRIDLAPRPVRLPLNSIGKLHLPAVLHWDMTHYVVLERVRQGRALIHDPAGRSQWLPINEVSRHFTGVALELRPTNDFTQADKRERLRLSQLLRNVTGLKRALLQTLVLSLVLQAFVLVLPYFMQVAIDRVLPTDDRQLLQVLALGFAAFMAINVGAGVLRSFVLLWAGTSLGFGLSANIARRLFRLPVDWFEKRHIGDILSRFQSLKPIQNLLLTGAVGALVDGGMALLTLALMFFYSPALAFVALIAFALYLIIRLVSFALERDAKEEMITTSAAEQSTLIESLRGITALRLYNRETLRHALWQGKLADNMNAGVRSARIGVWQQAGNSLVFGAENILTIFLAIGFVLDGGFSVGMVFAYLAYKAQFTEKAAGLVDQFIDFRMLALHLERLSDIALATEDDSFGKGADAVTRLQGRIELRDVRFRYSPGDPLVLDGVDLVVDPGDHVAITGPSGGGKSTLVKILLGLAVPDSGELLVDGMPLDRFGHKSYHDQVAAVLQDDNLFAGTLADNIALFDDEPDERLIVSSAEAASIHSDIINMPMAYDTLVGDMGTTVSGGQKQRILLARALYRRPKVLVMDEGTAHLDLEHEKTVNASISRLGITRVVVAHRAETLKAADRVLRLVDGKLQ